MNQTASFEKPRRQVFVRAGPRAGTAQSRARCLPGPELWTRMLFNSTEPVDVDWALDLSVGDGPADGPYPGMFAQPHWS